MKLASLAFVALLAAAHIADDPKGVVARPLSQFRDGQAAWLGYLLFGLLLLITGLYVHRLWRTSREGEAVTAGLAAALLALVAVTPSLDGFHVMFSIQLFLLLYAYYGVLLYQTKKIWYILHLIAPLALLLLTQLHSYGLWQKCFIVYFVAAAAAHEHLIRGFVSKPAPRPTPRTWRTPGSKRRKVYQLDTGQAWARLAERGS